MPTKKKMCENIKLIFLFFFRFNARQKETSSYSSLFATTSTSIPFHVDNSNTNTQSILVNNTELDSLDPDLTFSSSNKHSEAALARLLLNKKARDELAELRLRYDRKLNNPLPTTVNISHNTSSSSSGSSGEVKSSKQFITANDDGDDDNGGEGTLKYSKNLAVTAAGATLRASSSNSLDKNKNPLKRNKETF